jgi:DNA repair protein RecN (Recombination protein N)
VTLLGWNVLRELHIKDFAIIDELHLTLEPGFNILTGETGAGKSILIDAVTLILGARGDTSAIRQGAERGRVEGMLVLSPELQRALDPILEREGLEGDAPDILWLARELRNTGRTVARVNGRATSVSLLREIAEGLVDVHGQSDHLSLLRVREHVNLLDRYADLMPLRAQVAAVVRQIRSTRRELKRLLSNERDRMQRIDLLRFQVEEIQAADLKPGEKEDLKAELVRLSNAEQLVTLASGIVARLEEGGERTPAVLDLLGRGQRDMVALARVDATLEPQMQTLEEVGYQIEDLARTLRDYAAEIEFNPKRQSWVEERLALLSHLERKYGGDLEDVMAHAERAEEELLTLEHSDERIVELQVEDKTLVKRLSELALELSERRREAAGRLAAAVDLELGDLRMTGARFGVAFTCEPSETGVPLEEALPHTIAITGSERATMDETPVQMAAFNATGIDTVEFLVAANVGEGLKSLSRTASGGETSRLMLALKAVLSRADRTPTLIFDEIDQGIGGRIGAIVGTKLWQLSSPPALPSALAEATADTPAASDDGAPDAVHIQHQVLCITHLPQLAGFGDVHFKVVKEIAEGRTVTHVRLLDEDARLTELAQMLGTQGATARRGALEILEQARALKTPD